MKQETLLEKAKKIEPLRGMKHLPTEEEIELVFAWVKDEITGKQMCGALKKSSMSGNYLYFVAVCLREAYRQGKLKIVD